MQIKFGEKIRELRKRDGRKQEDLAAALGVTNQAVSRWEANGGYPDIEMIPAIANYFHITIDELFGYDSDRQIKLQSYIEKADQMASRTIMEQENPDSARRVEFLRNAISEFPSEWQLQYRLAGALMSLGFERKEQRVLIDEEGAVRYNTEINTQNESWKEAVSLFEEVLKKEIDDDGRRSAVFSLMWLYSLMGEQEKAERTARAQSSVSYSREVLLADASKSEKAEEYRAEAILALMHELYKAVSNAVMAKDTSSYSKEGLDTLLAVVRLYETIFEDGNYGIYHNDMCMLHLNCFSIAIELDDAGLALKYFEMGLEHFLAFQKVQGKTPFPAPLIYKAKNYWPSIVLLNGKRIEEDYMCFLPRESAKAIKENPRYASIFAI